MKSILSLVAVTSMVVLMGGLAHADIANDIRLNMKKDYKIDRGQNFENYIRSQYSNKGYKDFIDTWVLCYEWENAYRPGENTDSAKRGANNIHVKADKLESINKTKVKELKNAIDKKELGNIKEKISALRKTLQEKFIEDFNKVPKKNY